MSTTHRLYPVAALFLALSFLGAIATPRDCKADSCSSTAYAQEFEGGNGSLPAEWATGTGDFGASTGGFYGSLLGFGSRFIQNKTVPPLPCILRLTNLPPHNRVDVDFLLAIINSWDGIGGTGGGDAFHVTVNGSEVFSHIFGLGTGSSDYYPPAGVFMGSSGWNNAYNMYLDPVFHGIPDSSSTLEIRWYASGGPNQPSWEGGDNESWAIDHVRVVLHSVNLPTSLSLTSALNPSIFGEPVSLTATLTPSNASGTVGFFVGAAPVPFATSPVVGGVATTSLTGLAIGTTTILARYAPDSCYGTATSALLDQVVAGFALSTSTSGPGTITKTPDQAAYLPGAVVQLTAIPAPGWAFSHWSGDTAGTNPTISITMNGNRSVSATFTRLEYPLSITIVGGGTVMRLPNQPAYFYGDSVRLTAVPAPGWTFGGWSGDATVMDSTTTVTMNGDKTVIATFAAVRFPTVHVVYPNGGEVLVVGSDYKFSWYATDSLGIANVTIGLSRDSGATYETIAEDSLNTGSLVWRVTGPGANTAPAPVFAGRFRVTARNAGGNSSSDESDAAFAIYELEPHHTVAVSNIGKGSIVRSPNLPLYEQGSTITLTAVPDPGWGFVGWTGDAVDTTAALQLVVSHNLSLTATFRDAVSPGVSLIYPNGGQVLITGSPYKFAWDASDQEGVVAVDLALSRDNGATWEQVATGETNTGTYVWVVSRPGDNSGGAPVFESLLRVSARDSAGNVGSDQSDAPFAIHDLNPLSAGSPPAAYAIGAIAPNPMSGSSVISYALPEAANVRLSIFDLQGREVAVLSSGVKAAGTYRGVWRPSAKDDQTRTGIYFVRYVTPRGAIVRRIALTR